MSEAARLFSSSNGSLPSTYSRHVHGRMGHEDRNPFGEDDGPFFNPAGRQTRGPTGMCFRGHNA